MFSAFSKLDKHTKAAIFVAPILLILGFAAADLWEESKAMEKRFFVMEPVDGQCDITAKNCVLQSEEFKISVYIEDGITTANSTFPLDTMTLLVVNSESDVTTYRMGMKDSPYYWHRETDLQNVLATTGAEQKMRFIATVKGGQYIAEFVSRTAS